MQRRGHPARPAGSGPGASAGAAPAASTPRRSRTFEPGFVDPAPQSVGRGNLLQPVLRTGVEPVGRASETQLRVRRTENLGIAECGFRITESKPDSIPQSEFRIRRSRRLESNQLLRDFSAALLPSQLHRVRCCSRGLRPRLQTNRVPRQGIEPCLCRLKAGGFAIEACEAPTVSAARLRDSTFHLRPVPGAGIEPAASTFKRWNQSQH